MKRAFFPLVLLEVVLSAAEELAAPSPPSAVLPVEPGRRYNELILHHAQIHRLSPRLLKAVIRVESRFDPGCESDRGARGLMQLMPGTAVSLGVNSDRLDDPDVNIGAGSAYLEILYRMAKARYHLRAERLQDAPPWVQRRVLAAYNGGPRMFNPKRWPGQTRHYVRRVAASCRLGPSWTD